MWDKIFTLSLVTFVIGIAIFLVVSNVVPNPSQPLLLAASVLIGIGGMFVGVAGFALLLTSKVGSNP